MKNNRKHQNIKTLTQTKIWERYQNTNPEKKTILSLRSKPQKRILEDQNYEKKRWRTYRRSLAPSSLTSSRSTVGPRRRVPPPFHRRSLSSSPPLSLSHFSFSGMFCFGKDEDGVEKWWKYWSVSVIKTEGTSIVTSIQMRVLLLLW